MMVTTVNVTGYVKLPDNSEASGAVVTFQLSASDYDTVGDTAIPKSKTSVTLGSGGSITAPLWPNDRGTVGTHYIVDVVWTNNEGKPVSARLGTIQPVAAGPNVISDLLAIGNADFDGIAIAFLTEEEYQSAIAAADILQAGVTYYNSTADGLAATSSGDYFIVKQSGGLADYLNDGGSATFNTWIKDPVFDTVADFLSSGVTGNIGDVVTTRDGIGRYIKVADGTGHVPLGSPDWEVLSDNVRAFGAVGDGITDSTDAIQAAFDNIDDVFIPFGVFMASTLTPRSNLRVRGFGTIKMIATTSANLKWLIGNDESDHTARENLTIEGITLDGNRAAMPSAATQNVYRRGVHLPYYQRVQLLGVTVIGFGSSDNSAVYGTYGNNAIGISLVECHDFTIRGCAVSDCAHYGIQLWICAGGDVSGNRLVDNGAHGIGGAALKNVAVNGNVCEVTAGSAYTYSTTSGQGQGIWLRRVSSCTVSDNIVFRHSSVTANEGAAIQLGEQSGLASAPIMPFMSDVISNPSALQNDASVVSGNLCEGSWQKGIYVWGGNNFASKIVGNSVKGVANEGIYVTSNRANISDNDVSGGCTNFGIALEGRDGSISGNRIYGVNGTAIKAQGVRMLVSTNKIEDFCLTSAGYAILNPDWSNNPTITSNHIYSSVTANITAGIRVGLNVNGSVVTGNFVDGGISNGIYGEIDNGSFKTGHRWGNNSASMSYIAANPAYRYKIPSELSGVFLWADSTGDLRIEYSVPTSDLDGVVVGAQT